MGARPGGGGGGSEKFGLEEELGLEEGGHEQKRNEDVLSPRAGHSKDIMASESVNGVRGQEWFNLLFVALGVKRYMKHLPWSLNRRGASRPCHTQNAMPFPDFIFM